MSLAGTKYWDLFELRTQETIEALKKGTLPPLRRLSLHVTNKCNLRCAYCNEKHTPKELPRWMFVKLLEEYSAMGGGVLHMTGGEPMCVSYLQDEIIKGHKQYPNIDFHINTNATVPISGEFLSSCKRIKISLDSSDKAYFDELVGVEGSFDKVWWNLYSLDWLAAQDKEDAPVTSITYTMTAENYRQIPAFMEMFHGTFPQPLRRLLQLLQGHG